MFLASEFEEVWQNAGTTATAKGLFKEGVMIANSDPNILFLCSRLFAVVP